MPDTTWTGNPNPHSWQDLAPRVNTSLGGQSASYPLGYKPTEFVFKGAGSEPLTTENWATSVATLVMVKQRLHEVDSQQLWQYRLPSIAASESELTAVEQRLGEPLDPSHRAFLCHASGWPAFFQTVDLFGAPDLLGGSRWDHAMAMLGAVEDDVLAASNVRRQHLLPIACSPVDLDLFVITRRAAPEPGVVLWLAGYVVERFSNFEEYFAAMIDYNRREVDALDKHNRQP